MADVILLEMEEDIRFAAKIISKKYGIDLGIYADYSNYKKYMQEGDIVLSSDIVECEKHNFCYIKKPYTAHQLLELIGGVK